MISTVAGRTSQHAYVGLGYERRTQSAHTGSYTETFEEAVARIGSTETTYLIDEDTYVTEHVVIPASLKLKFRNRAMLINDGGSIEFEGNPFVDNQAMSRDPLFSGFLFSEIDFTGKAPSDISSEIADHVEDSVTQRLYLLTNWFSSSRARFHCYSRPITDTDEPVRQNCQMSDGHTLYFRNSGSGVFDNTYTRGSYQAAFTMGDYSSFYSEAGALIFESSAWPSPQIVSTKVGCRDCKIEWNHFVSNSGGGDSASANVVIAGSSYNCHIRNNWFDGIAGYHAGIIQTAGQNPPEWCTINDNFFTGFLTQLVFITSGRHCQLNRNTFDLEGVAGYSAFSLIDVEPNFTEEIIEDLEINYNIIDLRNVTHIPSGGPLYNTAIIVQGVNTAGAKRVHIIGNHILATPAVTQSGIVVNGVTELDVRDNYCNAGLLYAISQCNKVQISGNTSPNSHDGSAWITACANVWTENNIFHYPFAAITEGETRHPGGGNGSNSIMMMHSGGDGRIYESYEGLVVEFQGVDFTVDQVTTNEVFQSFTVASGTVPSCGNRNFPYTAVDVANNRINVPLHDYVTAQPVIYGAWGSPAAGLNNGGIHYVIVDGPNHIKLADSAANATGNVPLDITSQGSTMQQIMPFLLESSTAVDIGTNTINFPNHQLADLSAVQYWSDTEGIGGLTVNGTYYVIYIDDDHIKLANTRAEAITDTAIDLTSAGVGPKYFNPSVITKFLNNKYKNNSFGSYILGGTSVNYGSFQDFEDKGTVTVDPASVAANSTSSQTFTLTGAVVGDSLAVNPPAAGLTAGLLVMQSFVSAANQITIVFYNTTGAPIDQASADWTYKLSR